MSDVQEWDPNNQYAEVVDAVKQATNDGELKVYAVARTQVKTEYWVVGVDKGEKRIVGAKALGVES